MKKPLLIIILIVCMALFVYVTIVTINSDKLKVIGKNIEMDTSSCNIEFIEDTHGGFLGDGELFAKITCKTIDYEKLATNWKKLPLTKNLKESTSLKNCRDGGCKDIYERYSIPEIKDGYYYFYDSLIHLLHYHLFH